MREWEKEQQLIISERDSLQEGRECVTCVSQQLAGPKAGMEPGVSKPLYHEKRQKFDEQTTSGLQTFVYFHIWSLKPQVSTSNYNVRTERG